MLKLDTLNAGTVLQIRKGICYRRILVLLEPRHGKLQHKETIACSDSEACLMNYAQQLHELYDCDISGLRDALKESS